RDVELVEDHEAEAWVGHQLDRLGPGALGRRHVARAVLGLPGEALPHGVPRNAVAERRKRVALAGVPGALDELHHTDPMTASEHAQGEPECRRRFALTGPGMDDQQTFLDGFAGDLGVLHRLAFRHLGAMAFGGFVLPDHRDAPTAANMNKVLM